MTIKPIYFPEPLVEGVVQMRKTPFTMTVKLGDEIMACRCPTTWHIGNLEVAGRPCLLSRNDGTDNKTPFTVEAVSLDEPEAEEKKWIGINQTATNRYMEYYLEQGGFSEMVSWTSMLRRDRLSKKANLDFIVGNTAVAIKAPLVVLGLDIPEAMRVKKGRSFLPTERFMKRITALRKNSPSKRIVLVLVYLYDRPEVRTSDYSEYYDAVMPVLEMIKTLELEVWQANFIITKEFVYLDHYKPLRIVEEVAWKDF